MIKIKTTQEAVNKLASIQFEKETISDILFQTYLLDTQFNKNHKSEIIILQKDENIEIKIPIEIEQYFKDYVKRVYILDDFGEGIVTYTKLGESYE